MLLEILKRIRGTTKSVSHLGDTEAKKKKDEG